MSADPTTAAKLCTVCGIDCAGKPRIKDQQGRYICKECFDKAKQTRQTQKSPPPAAGAPAATVAVPADGDNSFLLAMGSKESTGTAGTKPCPECGRAMPTNAVICVGCGFNTSTGKRLSVKVLKAKKEKAQGDGSKSGSMSIDDGPKVAAVIFIIYAGCGALQFVDPMAGLIGGLVCGVIGLGIAITVLLAAFRDGIMWGLLSLFVPLVILIWVFLINDDTKLKWMVGGQILGGIAQLAIVLYVASTKVN